MKDLIPTPFFDDFQDTAGDSEIGYPVQLSDVELIKLQMHRIPWHWHAEMEAVIVHKGEIWLFTDDARLRLSAGQGVLINQNIMHSIHPVDKDVSSCIYRLKFHPSFLFGFVNTMISGKYLAPVLHSTALKITELHQNDCWHRKLLDILNQIITVNQEKKYGYELITKSCLCRLWYFLLEKAIPENLSQSKQNAISLDEARVKAGIQYIQEHYSEHISLEQLADSIHISKSECCRCFKRTLQLTPFEYIMRYRILEAAAMMQENDPRAHSMSMLAFSVGFNNTSYFNKLFKQYFYCTPSEYKRRLNKY